MKNPPMSDHRRVFCVLEIAIAGKPAPTVFEVFTFLVYGAIPIGAGLPAMRPVQALKTLPDTLDASVPATHPCPATSD